MFTGIVEELGRVVALESAHESARLTVRAALTGDAAAGDSIAVNGVCLTVSARAENSLTFDVMRETLVQSSLGTLVAGAPVNLERAMRLDGRLGGHLVQGHVDGLGTVVERVPGENWELMRVTLAPELQRYVVRKGSISVDGVSLTVADLSGDDLTVGLIPTTLRATTLGVRQVGDTVNLEVDVVAKYVENMLRVREGKGA